MSQLVLAIEPDLRQSVIVTRIVREKVHADVTVVDSRDAALEAIGRAMPDVLLLSALLSPRDEDELVAHLRTLAHAGHLQTHTIPQLASSMMGPSDPERGGRGLLAKFRRKKEPERVATGCDPNVFAEEIRVFLQRAADKKRELLEAAPGARDWSPVPVRTAAPAAEPASAGQAESSSWSSPFEWPSDRASLATDPESLFGHRESPVADPESLIAKLEPFAGDPELSAAESASLVVGPESSVTGSQSLIAAFETVPVVPADPELGVAIATAQVPLAEEPGAGAANVEWPAAMSGPVPPEHADEEYDGEPAVAARPTLDYVETLLELTPETDDGFDIGSGVDEEYGIGEAGLDIRDQGLGIRDPQAPARLGSLATWTRSEATRPVARASADDVRAIIASLAVPHTIASVAYARGCRIRRVRVPGGPQAPLADAPGPVILSRKLLEENRNANANP